MRVCIVLLVLLVAPALAQTIGVHVVTAHANRAMHDDTPGVYVLHDGWAAGVYRNSLPTPKRRHSVYIGRMWGYERWGLMLGVASGYQRERLYGREFCPPDPQVNWVWYECWRDVGHTRGALGPMAVASVSFPEAHRLIGVVPRLSIVDFKRGALHLSLESSL